MNSEEFLAKIGLDGTAFSSGLRRVQAEAHEFGEKGKLGFVKAEDGARSFRRTLDGIAEQSPILGGALKLALDPIAGTLAAAGAAAAWVFSKLEEINTELDKQAGENMKPITDAWQKQHDLSKQLNQDIADHTKWLDDEKRKREDIFELTKKQVEQENERYAKQKAGFHTAKEKAEFDVQHAQKLADIAKESRSTVEKQAAAAQKAEAKAFETYTNSNGYFDEKHVWHASGGKKTLREAAQDTDELLKAQKADLDKASAKLLGLKVESAKASPEEAERFRLLANMREIKDALKGIIGQKGLEESLSDAQKEFDRLTQAVRKTTSLQDDIKDKIKEQGDAYAKAKADVESYGSAIAQARAQELATAQQLAQARAQQVTANHAEAAGLAPTMQQVGAYAGPYGMLARRILGTRNAITQHMAAGDFAGAEALRKQLQGYDVRGFDTPDWTQHGKLVPHYTHVRGLEEQFNDVQSYLAQIANLTKGEGLPVLVKGVAE